MKPKTFRFLLWLTSLAAALLLLALVSAGLVFWQPGLVKPLLESALTPEGGSASFSRIDISLSPPRVTIENLQRSHPMEPVIKVAKLRLDLDPDGIWGSGPWIELLEAEGLRIELDISPKESSGPVDLSGLNLILAIKRADIKNAALSLTSGQGRLDLKVSGLSVEPQEKGKRQLKLASRVAWLDPSGGQLAWAAIKGSGSLDMPPNLAMDLVLADGGLALAGLRGPLTGSARLILTQKELHISELSLAVATGVGSLTPASIKLEGQRNLEDGHTTLKLLKLELGRQLSLSGEFTGNLGDQLSGKLVARGRASLDQLSMQNAQLEASLAGNLAAPRMHGLAIRIPEGSLFWRGKKTPLGEVKVSGKASMTDGGSIRLENLKTEAKQIGSFNGNVLIENGALQSVSLRTDAIEAQKLLSFAQEMTGRLGAGWQAQGNLKMSADLGADLPGQWKASLVSNDLGFGSTDGTVLVGQMAGQLSTQGKLSAQPVIDAQLKLSSGQALWGTVFLDLAQAPFELSGQTHVAAPSDLRQIKFKGALKGYGRFSGTGRLTLTGGKMQHQGSLHLQEMNMTKLFNTFVRDPFSVSQPNLAAWQVRGRAELEMRGKGVGTRSDLTGRLRLNRAGLQTGQGASLKQLDLDLPFTYSLGSRPPGEPARPGRRSWGSLNIKGLRAPGLDLEQLELPVAVTPNRLWVLGAVDVPLAGGKVQIFNLMADDPLSTDFKTVFAAQLEDIDLAKLAGPTLPLSGFLAGRLAEVSLTTKRLKAKGRLQGSLFGGSLGVRGISVELPFNPGREIRADIEARQIHMEPLSQALKVGRITGGLDADLNGLRLAYGQPVAFQLRVESVEMPGVDQQVSLRAVNSISLLGTGTGLSGMGLGLFASFFKEFPYEKIAFSCKLKNDEFKVRGLIHEDGVEYLVKRPLLMGINVINRNPDNRISFSDMLERLQRIQQDNAPRLDEAEKKEK